MDTDLDSGQINPVLPAKGAPVFHKHRGTSVTAMCNHSSSPSQVRKFTTYTYDNNKITKSHNSMVLMVVVHMRNCICFREGRK